MATQVVSSDDFLGTGTHVDSATPLLSVAVGQTGSARVRFDLHYGRQQSNPYGDLAFIITIARTGLSTIEIPCRLVPNASRSFDLGVLPFTAGDTVECSVKSDASWDNPPGVLGEGETHMLLMLDWS